MKMCMHHWVELKDQVPNPLAAQIAALQLMMERFLMVENEPNVYKAQEMVEAKGGCMACYFGPTFVPDLVARIKDGRLPLKPAK
jgi:hypothetical protein